MLLIRNAVQIADPYLHILDDAPVPDDSAVLLQASRFHADADELAARSAPTGVVWPNDRDAGEIAPWLDRLSLVTLVFPTFRDGRAYSQARILRERFSFRGELRATGDVLRDQFLLMHRAGFDAYEVRKPGDARAFIDTVERYSVFYQPSADGERGMLWRRIQPWSTRRGAVIEAAS